MARTNVLAAALAAPVAVALALVEPSLGLPAGLLILPAVRTASRLGSRARAGLSVIRTHEPRTRLRTGR